ncbi:MAG: acyltransferase [Candidatus Woesebacteria bacterium]|nr:acyltransferase [Candidatus Woesebacteria bacterium]
MKQHVKSVDYLRTLAILGVVLIHTTSRTLEAAKFNLLGFPLTLFLNQTARFAVPLFFIISGFTLETSFDQNSGYITYFKKRFSKIFIPYIFWSGIYYLFIYNQNRENFFLVLAKGDASYQLYFIPALCIFYLLFPILHKIYKIISNKFFLILLLASQIWLLYRDYFIKEFRFDDPIHIAVLAYFFFVIGIVAARNKDTINLLVHKWKYLLLLVIAGSGIYVFREGLVRFLATGNTLSYYSQWRPSVLIYTVALGLILFHLFEKPKFQFPLIAKLSKLSFLVFLIHVIVLEVSWSFFEKNLFIFFSGNTIGKILFDPIFFGITVGVSFLIAYILHKIPRLYRLIG